MTKQDKEEFTAYLAACTDKQLEGVLEKEKGAGRMEYAGLVKDEMKRRGIANG